MNLQILHDAATAAAKNATIQHLTKHGEDFYCGFAWVQVSEKGSTKLGRALKSIGFTKAYGGGLQLWNPSGTMSQSMTLKEVGAQAYADVLQTIGVRAYVGDGYFWPDHRSESIDHRQRSARLRRPT